MANGKSSDPEPYVIRSGIRYGLKREFIFAIKSQSEHSLSRTRTRSGKPSPPIPPGNSKRVKKSDARDVPSPQTPIPIPMEVDNSTKDVVTPTVKKMDSVQAIEIEIEIEAEKKSPRRFTRSALAVDESKPELLPQAPEIDGLKKRTKKKKADVGIPIVVEVSGGESEMERDKSPRRLTRFTLKSALETPAITTNGGAKEDFSGKSDGTGMLLELENLVEVVENDGLEAVALGEIPMVLDACQRSETESNKSPRIAMISASKSHAAEESAGGETKPDSSVLDSEATLTEVMTRRLTRSASSKVISGVSEASTLPPSTVADATGKLVETPIHVDDPQGLKIDSGPPQNNGAFSKTPVKRLTRSVLKVMPIYSVADEVGISVETPVIVDDQEGSKMESGITEKSSRKFSRLAAKVLKENTSAIVNGDFGLLEIPTRRCTRSLLKTEIREEPAAGESSDTTTELVGSDESRGWASTDDGLSSVMLSKKMELKMSKKIVLNKLPCNVRELLGTGLLEGLSVMYCVGKQHGLEGVVKGNGILCSCNLCNGFKVVSAYNFELHAGSTKKHPSDFIFLGNGKNLHDILRECTSVPLDMLESAIRNAVGPLPQSKFSLCQKCKESFHTSRTGKFGLLCDSCLLPRLQQQTIVRPSPRTPSNAKLSGKVLAGDCSDGISKNTPSQKKSTISTNFLLEDASDVLSKNTSSQKKIVQGKITRKDVGLHKLVFMDDILPEGTEVGYYICGKRLLEGYIKDSGIYCRCCNSVVSPSQFEAHAGRASRRKPYNNIYTSNGVSLHELSVSLSKDRKLSSNENDDLCSICADGGDLLLCDLCPRAFHKECVGLSSVPKGDWHCRYCHDMHQREKAVGYNDNAIAAGRVSGVDPIEQIIKRYIRIVATSSDFSVCVLCRCHDFSKSGFDQRTVLICDQCEKEYHVGCLKDHGMCDLKELPEGEWFCCAGCSEIHAALHESLLRGLEPLQDLHTEIIRKKYEGKGVSQDAAEVRWRLLSGKTSSDDNKLLLSKAVSIFHESFDPIVDAATGRDLIPSMVYGRSVRDQDFGGMYCAVLTVNSSIVSAGILRVLGCDVAELPLVATSRDSQGQGYFQSLFSCIEKLLEALKVKHFVLPAAEEARSIWTNKFGFSKISIDQLYEYTKGARPIIFQGTSLLHKRVPLSQSCLQEGHVS